MSVVKTNASKLLQEDLKKYMEDFYSGKVKAGCDEDCPEDCEKDHGYYELPETFPKLFDA